MHTSGDDRPLTPCEALDQGDDDALAGPVVVDPLHLAPTWTLVCARGATIAALSFFYFVVYCNLRALVDTTGFQWSSFLVALAATLAMTVMVVFLVGVPEMPEAYLGHVRPRWHAARGRCPACGYDLHGGDGACPECGSSPVVPPPYRLGNRAVRRFALLLVAAWAGGSIAGEWWMVRDERAFAREVAALDPVTMDFARQRAWPCTHSRLWWKRGHGIVTPEEMALPGVGAVRRLPLQP